MECGECNLCCKLLDVPGIAKQGEQCKYASLCGKGCTIYNKRPAICKSFNCLWLHSPVLGENLRPDKCGVIFDLYAEEKTVIAMTEYNWNELKVQQLIQQILFDGYIVWILMGKDRTLLLPEGVSETEALDKAKIAWRKKVWQEAQPTQKT